MTSRQLQLYLTTESPCGYYSDRLSRNLVPDPQVSMNRHIYDSLIQHGFRRSGNQAYRPYCKGCEACIACRIRIEHFHPNRSQRRCLKRNADLRLQEVPAAFSDDIFDLYRRYLDARHGDGSMANPAEDDFRHFLLNDWGDVRFLCFYRGRQLVAVAVTDVVADGLSAMYSFFEPALEKRSLGTYCILAQIEHARSLGLQHVYLGYWIDGHPKMAYKQRFSGLELYRQEQWRSKTGPD